jgi:hypothetical protein
MEVPAGILLLPILNIVISMNVKKALLSVKLSQGVENTRMGGVDMLGTAIFHQLIPIAYFNICESGIQIIVQRIGINCLILGELIRPGVVSPVDVAEKDQPALIVKYYPVGFPKNCCQSL